MGESAQRGTARCRSERYETASNWYRMKNLINKLLGRSPTRDFTKSTPSSGFMASGQPRDPRDNPVTIEDGSDNATRRQLVQVLMRDVMRRHGISSSWIECQLLVVASRTRGAGLFVRLVVRHWDQRLINHMYAFQQTLMTDITRFEPRATDWLHGMSWQLEVEGSCPYTVLPEKAFWSDGEKSAAGGLPAGRVSPPATPGRAPAPLPAAAAAAAAAPVPARSPEDTETLKDLERLFMIRDREINREGDDGQRPDFEATQPASYSDRR